MHKPVETRAVHPAVVRFLRQLVTTYKAVVLYPRASTIPRENAGRASALLGDAGDVAPDLRIAVDKDGLRVEGAPALTGQAGATTFARELYHRSVTEVRFRGDTTSEALLGFLGVLRRSPEEIEASGGFEAVLWDEGVDSITVAEASTVVAEAPPTDAGSAADIAWPPDSDHIEMLLATAKDPRSEGYRVLVRVLLDTELIASYVASVFQRAVVSPADVEPGDDLAAIARIIGTLDDTERRTAFRTIADAMSSLPPGQLRARSAERILAAARTDRGVAAFVRQVGIDEMCRVLTEGLDEDAVSVEGLARAIRNLAQITLAARDEVTNAAGAAMRGAGIHEATVSAVLSSAAPARIVSDGDSDTAVTDTAVDSVLRLVELASAAPGDPGNDPGLLALRDEAYRGFRDSDVIGALVTLAILGMETPAFDESMNALEGGLGLLLERGEFEVAAEAADALLRAAQTATPQESERMTGAVRRLADVREMRALYRAMHVYDRDTLEYQACRRLLATLGGLAIEPLLEMLADEPDMSIRKSMVDLISSVADHNIEEVGDRIIDARWYFVRNVVSILGSARRSEVLPYLDRTSRHADARVRRETIRALAGVPDPRAPELLAAALNDSDAGNVQLAARYLGSLRYAAAVPALLAVARGEGTGNREHGPRAEAIEALGLVGSPEALPGLETLAGRRRLIGGQRSKDLAAVAATAITAIEAARGEVGR